MSQAAFADLSFDQIVALWKSLPYEGRRQLIHRNFRPPLGFFLYKYKAVNAETLPHIADILLESRLYLCSPDQVNDPFDTSACVRTEGTTEQWRARLKRLIASKSGLGYMQRRMQLDEFMSKPRQFWIDTVEETHKKNAQSVGLCSFTRLPKSIVMWSHYANQHSGLCFMFERAKDDTGALIAPTLMKYVEDYPVVNWLRDDHDEALGAMLTHKYIGWEYEQEWRLFVPGRAKKYLRFSPPALSGLILGARIPDTSLAGIRKILAAREAKQLPPVILYKAALHPSEYRLVVRRVT